MSAFGVKPTGGSAISRANSTATASFFPTFLILAVLGAILFGLASIPSGGGRSPFSSSTIYSSAPSYYRAFTCLASSWSPPWRDATRRPLVCFKLFVGSWTLLIRVFSPIMDGERIILEFVTSLDVAVDHVFLPHPGRSLSSFLPSDPRNGRRSSLCRSSALYYCAFRHQDHVLRHPGHRSSLSMQLCRRWRCPSYCRGDCRPFCCSWWTSSRQLSDELLMIMALA